MVTLQTGILVEKKLGIANWPFKDKKDFTFYILFIVKKMAENWNKWNSTMETVMLNKFYFVSNCHTRKTAI